jgi:proline iminopeptidase
MERLRALLGVSSWQVFGGSWGSTLALAYAQAHPDRVTELVLRGIFLCRPREISWFYQEGTSRIFPDAWEDYLAPIPESERGDLVRAYHARLTSDDPEVRLPAARAWSIWEGSTCRLLVDVAAVRACADPTFAEAFARIECHYFVNDAFMDHPDQLLEGVQAIRHLPATIVHGRYDVICPVATAWELHRAWPEARLDIVRDAGHSAFEPGIRSALIEATDRYAEV